MNAKKFHDYDAFVDKFVPKKTTDDCYTPQPVYDAVSGIDNAKKGRDIFGGGFLLSERAAAERAAAERIQLSVRERRLVKSLNTVKL